MKLKKYNTNEYVHYWNSAEIVMIPEYEKKPNEVRGVWVSTVANIDTPKGLPVEEYKAYLSKMIENIASYNINTIIFQVRPMSDAFYPSKLNPWSRFITGVEGQDPGFDVFAYVIETAKKYNIKVHAWMNPYRVSSASLEQLGKTKEEFLETLATNNFARLHPEHTIVDGAGKIILSPSHPEVIDFVTKSIIEVAENYDIEGVHIDDYFYPYAKIPETNEHEDYLKYRACESQTLDDFRRMNVDIMIKNIHDELKNLFSKTGKKVQFGISPFAIYRTHSSIVEGGWECGSYNSKGALQCYSELYSDVYKWMKEHWIDYVVPQIYFPFERQDVTYHDLTRWWSNIAKETDTILYIGTGLYQMGSNEFWQNPDEIVNQLAFNQNFENIAGSIFFTYHDLVKGQNEIKDQSLDKIKNIWTK
ncbi:MAG: glycoside hydrolase family 10 protein [Bacilli bacterium]